MGAPLSTQLDLKALQLRIAHRIAPGQLRRLVRNHFPRLYAELLERDSPAGLVDDLFRFAENHGDTHVLVNTLVTEWPGLRHPSPIELATFTAAPRATRLSSLLVLLLGPIEDIGPPHEDLSVPAPESPPAAQTDVRPDEVLPLSAALPAPKRRGTRTAPPPTPPPPPLTSLHQLRPLLRQAAAPCSREVGGGIRIDLEVSSDAQGRWSRTTTDGLYSKFHRCLTRRIEHIRTRRHDAFPANDSAPIVLIFAE